MTAGSLKDIILIADPRILAINIIDNHEPMIDLRLQETLAYGDSPEIPDNTDYTRVRKTVYDKLLLAQTLLPKNFRLCLCEGYRSLQLQKKIFDEKYAINQSRNPDWTQDQIFIETTKLVSPIINQNKSTNVPPHSTGGAVDVCLLNEKDERIDMGMAPEEWMEDDGSKALTHSTIISASAQQHRSIMHDALSAAGFVNYPTEYWHWSYGDRYWAYHKNQPHAIYGSYQFS